MQMVSNAHLLPFSPGLPEAADLCIEDNIYDDQQEKHKERH